MVIVILLDHSSHCSSLDVATRDVLKQQLEGYMLLTFVLMITQSPPLFISGDWVERVRVFHFWDIHIGTEKGSTDIVLSKDA